MMSDSNLQKSLEILANYRSDPPVIQPESPRLTHTQLQDKLRSVRHVVETLSLWRHRKSDRLYRVITVSLREADLEPLVTYYQFGAPQEPTVHFSRPLDEWLEKFEETETGE